MGTKKKPAIKYTDRDFQKIKSSLVEYAKRYYPNTYKDFNEASFGSLMLDTVAYVGDVLSFYLDYQANETFLDSAIENRNILRIAKQMGYKHAPTKTSHGIASFFIIVPATAVGAGYDKKYLPILQRGSRFTSSEGSMFTLVEDVDFGKSTSDVLVAEVDATTGYATSYALKAFGKVISGEYRTSTVVLGEYKRFRSVLLSDSEKIAEIVSVHDSDGNAYYEVDYLSQDVVYGEFANPSTDQLGTVPKLLKPIVVPRRFVVERDTYRTFLRFGYGSESDLTSDLILDPAKSLLKFHAKDYITDASFDPYNLISSDKFGVSPSDTTLTITYRVNTAENVNVPTGGLTTVRHRKFRFKNNSQLTNLSKKNIIESLEVLNEAPILGDTSYLSSDEIKTRAYGSFYTQSRAVTKQDYKSLVYSMPPQFGSIKRCNLYFDKDSLKRNINLYILMESPQNKFMIANSSIKQNLKTWINRHKMMNDTIDILDAKIVNFGINFTVLADQDSDKARVHSLCVNALMQHLQATKQEIGEDFQITNLYKILNTIPGVSDTLKVKIVKKVGNFYSDTNFDIESNMSADRRYISIPENVIYEVKYPDSDIQGIVR